MLPLRIELDGFLTYRQNTVLDFRDEWLWTITGANGVGKSGIFDAITFALFGEHRGGKQREELLISQGADFARVAFDFEVGGAAYRLERTLSRRRSRHGKSTGFAKTYQVYALEPASPGAHGTPLPGTDTVNGLEEWVHRTIGLTAKTFGSSVLLRQGEADKFVLTTPAERKGVLMEILDLTPYLRLEAAARKYAREWEDKARDTGREYDALSHATPEALVRAREEREAAQTAARVAEGAVRAAVRTLDNARRYADLMDKIGTAQKRLEEVKAMLAEAPNIDAAARELADLDQALPKLRAIFRHRDAAVTARAEAAKNHEQANRLDMVSVEATKQEKAEAAVRAETAYEQARNALAEAREEESRLRPLAEAARVLTRWEKEGSEAAGEAARLEGETAGLAKAEKHHRECSLAARALAALNVMADSHDESAAAQKEFAVTVALSRSLKEEAERASAVAEAAGHDVDVAVEAERQTELALASKNTELVTVEQELANRRAAGEESTCSRCGQVIDAAHIVREIADLEGLYNALIVELATMESQVEEKRREARRLAGEKKRLDDAAMVAVGAVRDVEHTERKCEEQWNRAQVRAARQVEVLPEPYRTWAADPAYPDPSVLARVRTLAAAQPSAEAAWRALDQKASRSTTLRLQAERALAKAAEMRASSPDVDLEAAGASHNSALERVTSLTATENEALIQWQEACDTAAAAEGALTTARNKRDELLKDVQEAETTAGKEEAAAAAVHAQLSFTWQEKAPQIDAQAVAKLEARQLELGHLAARAESLAKAREFRPRLEGEITAHEAGVSAIPEADRVAVAEAEESAKTAEHALQPAKVDADTALALETQMIGQVARRVEVEADYQRAVGKARDYGMLVKYLGKDQLQAWLVQEAQEVIGQAANVFLGAISDGLLRLELRPKGDDLEILISDLGSGQEPMEVKFVSGSQRFRAAVALALAIGQYSGGASRAIKSVIIDEGFGSLDADGRRQMIEQLKALEGTLDRVILVSHHETFHEAFPNGYHIEKKDGISRAVPRREMANLEAVGV